MKSPPETTSPVMVKVSEPICRLYVCAHINDHDETRIIIYDTNIDLVVDMSIDEWPIFVGNEKFTNIPLLGGNP